jgi:hypothetical protein
MMLGAGELRTRLGAVYGNVRFYGIGNGIEEVLNLAGLLPNSIERAWVVGGIILIRSSILIPQMVSCSSPYLSHSAESTLPFALPFSLVTGWRMIKRTGFAALGYLLLCDS